MHPELRRKIKKFQFLLISFQHIQKQKDPLKAAADFSLSIRDTSGFEQAQVCAGGVDTMEIHPETMESVLHKGLYFAGEIVDIDGPCGGYNLQWAWSSGAVAGRSSAKELI